MARRRRFHSNTVRTVGALLPSDVLAKAMDGAGLEGLDRKDFGLPEDVRLRDEINTAWNEATALWWAFVRELLDLAEDDNTATSLTREKWLLPLLDLLGFDDVDTLSSAVQVGGTDYPISHLQGHTPLHLMGARIGLDDRMSGIRGAARLSPHSLTQQFLNRSDDHLWGVVTNGLRLRLLRDSVSLTRQAFVEFDLEAMFNGQVFSDFVLLYRTAHATRFDGARAEECLLERWIAAARDEGIRALDRLRDGVEDALTTLGSGFLGHPSNTALRFQVEAGEVGGDDLYRHLLRLVYRFLFLFVAEDRDLLHLPDATPEQRNRYERFYSTSRLRELSARPIGAGNSDLWRGLAALIAVFGRDEGAPELGLPGLGSFLWSDDAIGPLSGAALDNEDLLLALRGLAQMDEDGSLRRIDFASLGAEELGSVYESLLELHPRIDQDSWEFTLGGGAGSERKTTGSYYTPTELISELLDSALMPVLERAAAEDDPEQAILDLKVVDPAAGSGHFLIAAAHRIGKRLAEVRTGEPEPPEEAYRTALRDVISRCIYAVDINELAVELCKVSLWLEALEPGKPLSFLDHHVLVGNSLFGATPAAIEGGIPDEAFVALTGDVKKVVAAQKKKNREALKGQDPLALGVAPESVQAGELGRLEELDDSDLETVHEKERLLAEWKASDAYAQAKLVADAWCAAFAIQRDGHHPELTEVEFRRLQQAGVVDADLELEIRDLADHFGAFHWHLGFPQILGTDPEEGRASSEVGFDVVLGNPPWERIKFYDTEWFRPRVESIADAPNSGARKKMISALEETQPALWKDYQAAKRVREAEAGFVRASGLFPLCGRGDVNTYAVFTEMSRRLLGPMGRVGLVVPTGILTDSVGMRFFPEVMSSQTLVSAYDFENRKRLFQGVDTRYRFTLLTLAGSASRGGAARFAFYLTGPGELHETGRTFDLSADEVALLNPNSGTCPVFRSRRDADLTIELHRRQPVFVREGLAPQDPWGFRYLEVLHLSHNAGDLVPTTGGPLEDGYRVVYEAKMAHHFDHRWSTFDADAGEFAPLEAHDPDRLVAGRYSAPSALSEARYEGVGWDRDWVLGWRHTTNATNERTLIFSVVPRGPVANNMSVAALEVWQFVPEFVATVTSFVVDYLARQKISGTAMTVYLLKQLAIPSPETFSQAAPWAPEVSISDFLRPRVVELVSTATDLVAFSRDAGFGASVYGFDQARRAQLRAELDAAMFHVFEVDREDASYILDAFPIVRRHDEKTYGSYRTKELILDAYDAMAKAIESGSPYETRLDPAPADESCRHEVV